jgi:hypothetical protein
MEITYELVLRAIKNKFRREVRIDCTMKKRIGCGSCPFRTECKNTVKSIKIFWNGTKIVEV